MNTAYHDLLDNGIDTPVLQSVSQDSQNYQALLQKVSSEPLHDDCGITRVNNIGLKLTVAETLTMPDSQKSGLEVECHWLTCTAYGVAEHIRRAAICEVIKQDPARVNKDANIKRFKGEKAWKDGIVGEYGQRVMWRHAEGSKTLWDVTVQLPGQWFETNHGLLSTLKLMHKLNCYGFKPSRQDWALNDYDKKFKMPQVREACETDNFAKFKTFDTNSSGKSNCGVNGMTVYCGSRESESMTRFYETTVCHGYQANRIELELKGDKAKFFWEYLLVLYKGTVYGDGQRFGYNVPKNIQELANNFAEEIAQFIVGQVDFVDKSNQWNNKSLKNCPRLGWWDDFIKLIGRALKLSPPKSKPTLKTKGNWMKKQWSRWLSQMIMGLGMDVTIDIITALAENGLNRLDKIKLSEDEELNIQVLQRDGISALFA